MDDQVLMITVAADDDTYIGIFVTLSTSDNFNSSTWAEDAQSADQDCYSSGIVTCAALLEDTGAELNIHFSVYIGSASTTYTV